MGGYFNRNKIMLTTSERSMLCSEGKGLRVRELSVGHEQDTSKPQQPQNGWWDLFYTLTRDPTSHVCKCSFNVKYVEV